MQSLMGNIEIKPCKIEQDVVNSLQKDIKHNREMIIEQAKILNNTINLQNNITQRVFSQVLNFKNALTDIKNEINTEKREHDFTNLLQSIIMSIINNSNVADAILSLLFKPSPKHILKLIEKEDIMRELKTLNKLLNSDERFVDCQIMDINGILKASEIVAIRDNDKISIEIKIPITKSTEWKLFRVIPIIFKKGSGLFNIIHTADYLVQDHNNHFGLMTKSEFDACKTSNRGKFACSFNEVNIPGKICENEILNGGVGDSCDIVETNDLSRIIRINFNTFMLNTHQNLSIIWGCNKIQRKHEVSDNVWIQLNPGCYLDVLNQHFEVPIENHEIRVETKMVGVNTTGFMIGSVDKIEYDNDTLITDEFRSQFRNLSRVINDNFNKSNVEVKTIIVPKSSNKYMIYSIIIISIVVMFFGFRCFPGCSLLRLLL